MRFVEYLIEQDEEELGAEAEAGAEEEPVEGEHLKADKSTAGKLASELLQGAGNNPKIAKKMANSFLHNLLRSIDHEFKQSQVKAVGGGPGGGPQPQQPEQQATGYEEQPAEEEPRGAGVDVYA